MTDFTIKLATILMIGAALAATPVLAQAVTSGNKGPDDIATNRAAPLTLPGELTPMPTPKVDGEAMSRDIFALEPGAALASLGTVTLDRSGDVSETPASETLRAIIDAAIKGKAS